MKNYLSLLNEKLKMKKIFSLFIIYFILTSCVTNNNNIDSNKVIKQSRYNFSTFSFPAKDKVRVFADYYNYNGQSAPLILLYHKASFSRGIFRDIAPRLVDLGYNVLAVDLRSGDIVNNIENLTHKDALEKGKTTNFVDAIPDLEASLDFAKHKLKAKKIIYWGSSYSASLGYYMVSKHPSDYKALITYSPGEYFKIEGKNISDFAKNVQIPTYISSAKPEEKEWQSIYDAIPGKKQFFLPTQSAGLHGTMVLNPSYNGSEEYWQNIIPFLKKMR